jgi:hypothetical protein
LNRFCALFPASVPCYTFCQSESARPLNPRPRRRT